MVISKNSLAVVRSIRKSKKEIRGGRNKKKKESCEEDLGKIKNKADFEEYFQKEVNSFRERTKRI